MEPWNPPAPEIASEYETLLKLAQDPEEAHSAVDSIRNLVLLKGIPDTPPTPQGDTLRGQIWRVLLRIPRVDGEAYMRLVARGESSAYSKIRDDTFRTFPQDKEFQKRVKERVLVRVLNAFIHDAQDRASEEDEFEFTYVQGMNVLAAVFLYVMPEPDAFFCFSRLVRHHIPTYVQPTLKGVHFGLKLLDETMRHVDPELFERLSEKRLQAALYAFPSVLTLVSNTPPLNEVVRVWDVMMAFGVHLNIVMAASRFVLQRDALLKSDTPFILLTKKLEDLDASQVVPLAVALVRQLPDGLYGLLAKHGHDASVFSEV